MPRLKSSFEDCIGHVAFMCWSIVPNYCVFVVIFFNITVSFGTWCNLKAIGRVVPRVLTVVKKIENMYVMVQ